MKYLKFLMFITFKKFKYPDFFAINQKSKCCSQTFSILNKAQCHSQQRRTIIIKLRTTNEFHFQWYTFQSSQSIHLLYWTTKNMHRKTINATITRPHQTPDMQHIFFTFSLLPSLFCRVDSILALEPEQWIVCVWLVSIL